MKKMLVLGALMLTQAVSASGYQSSKLFKVTVQNLTKGQPLTPPVVVVHAPHYKVFEVGQAASKGLGELATDGKTDLLVSELAMTRNVKRSATGSGVIMPGAKQELIVEANDSRFKISVVSMLARTNDAIASAMSLPTGLKKGQAYSVFAKTYDAGVELNNESCDYIPAPPCGNAGKGTHESEGFIRPHEGIVGVGDLDLARDTFNNVTAKVTVERVQ